MSEELEELTPAEVVDPEIYVLSSPELDENAFHNYLTENDFGDLLDLNDSPANKIFTANTSTVDHGERLAEIAGRKCYNAWEKGRDLKDYFDHIMQVGHGSILTHLNFTFLITGMSRSCSMEWIRHHVGTGISQESQRFISYKKPQMVMHPSLASFGSLATRSVVKHQFEKAFAAYELRRSILKDMFTSRGLKGTMLKKRINEGARGILPNETATSMVWSCNARALRNVLSERGGTAADLEIRNLAVMMYRKTEPYLPNVLRDFEISVDDLGFEYLISKYGKI